MTSSRIEVVLRIAAATAVALCFGSCIALLDPEAEVNVDCNCASVSTQLLDQVARDSVEGVYEVTAGQEEFGRQLVARWAGGRLCLYSAEDAVFIDLCRATSQEETTEFEGYYRVVRSGWSGRVSLRSYSDLRTGRILMGGRYSGDESLVLRRIRPLVRRDSFLVIAHRGGGRNSDRLGRSENSIAMITYAQTMGANAIEIDVRLTSDGYALVFHDDTFSPRTVQGSYLVGPVGRYSLKDIRSYGRLLYGEEIPTLEEMLDAVVHRTALRLVWIDVKQGAAVDAVLAATRAALADARAVGRDDLRIVMGIPDRGVLDGYLRYLASTSDWQPEVLCEKKELDPKNIPGCIAWAPRWSGVVETSDSALLTLPWTIDVREYMVQLFEASPDGILTNYPSMLSAIAYSRQR